MKPFMRTQLEPEPQPAPPRRPYQPPEKKDPEGLTRAKNPPRGCHATRLAVELEAARAFSGMTLAKLARRVGASVECVYELRRGRYLPNLALGLAITSVINAERREREEEPVSVEELFGG